MKKIVVILLLFSLGFGKDLAAQGTEKLVVASYNIRYANSSDSINGNGWNSRCPVITDLLNFNNFDIFGLQEVLDIQLKDLKDNLSTYAYVGVGRDDGKTAGEYAPIFYKKDKFEMIDSGTFWLSENTDYPNKGWDAVLPRICSWGKFREKSKGQIIWFFNLHMDHIGVKARKESAKLVLKQINKKCNDGDIVILTGDFNVDQTNESYAVLHDSGLLKDSYELAKIRYATNGTFNAFNTNLKTNSRIDHIFIAGPVTVDRYAILTDSYRGKIEKSTKINDPNFPKEVFLEQYIARLPSDHFPVRVELSYME